MRSVEIGVGRRGGMWQGAGAALVRFLSLALVLVVGLALAGGGGMPAARAAAPPDPPYPYPGPPPMSAAAAPRAVGPLLTRTLYVGTVAETSPTSGTCPTAGNTTCSLREAVTVANGDTNDTILFSLGGTFLLTAAGGGTLSVAASMTLDGNGQHPTISGGNAVRVFVIQAAIVTFTLQNLTVADGNAGNSLGGAIRNDVGAGVTINITNATLANNIAGTAGSGFGFGGAIFNGYGGTVNITDSTVSGNQAAVGGGAIENSSGGIVTVVRSAFVGNQVTSASIITGGGAINNNAGGGTVQVTNSTFANNSTARSTGGALNIVQVGGGHRVDVTASTFSGNTASAGGGGGIALGGDASASNVTVTGSIVAGNTGGDITGNAYTDGGGNVLNQTAAMAGLAPLANNGGPTQTFALLPGSPAINALACPTDPITGMTVATDARGVPRPQGAACDSGSYEALASPQSFVVTRAADDVNDANCTTVALGGCTLRQAVNASNLTVGAGTNTITFDATFGSAQTITLNPASGQLRLTRPVMITGPGAALLTVARSTANGTPTFRIFRVNGGVTAAISGLTITGGDIGAGDGGGILTQGNLSLSDVVVRNNRAGNNGGGIENNNNGTLTLTNITVSGNTAGFAGGGIDVYDAMLVATNATISGNTSTNGSSGGVAIFGSGAGQTGGTATLTNVTVSGNTANVGVGSGIKNLGTLNATRTIIAGNTGGDLSGSGINGTNVNNLVGGTPLLAPLGNYGGTTETQIPLPGSPAIDTGGAGCSATDQRGVTRPQGAACDVGAVESQGFTAGTLTGNNQSAVVNTPFTSAVGFTVSDTNSEPVQGGQVTFTITPGMGGASAAFGTAPMGCTLSAMNTVAVCTIPAGGTVTSPTFTANGTVGGFTIVATANGVPPTTFTETNTGIAPAAVNDAYTTAANTALTVPATGVLTNDTRGNPTAIITASTQPAHGTLTLNATDGSFVYTPTAGYTGSDSFTYTLTNVAGMSTGTVTITVNGVAPTAVADTASVTTGLSVTIPVLANDMPGNPAATLTAVSTPIHGTATISGASITYTPTSGYVGSDSFTYTISNGNGSFSTGSSTGTVSLTVNAALVTSLTTTAPTGAGSGNSGSATNPTLNLGGRLTLTTSATFNNGTSGTTSPLMYTSSNPAVATVDASGNIVAQTAGTTTITVSGPNGSRTTITITVTGAAGTGLMPNPQPMAHGTAATAVATPNAQPARHP